jgi:hypothetical protein
MAIFVGLVLLFFDGQGTAFTNSNHIQTISGAARSIFPLSLLFVYAENPTF